MTDERPTVELQGPFVPQTTTYSVSKRRATTENDTDVPSAMVEHVAAPATARLPRVREEVVSRQDVAVVRREEAAPTWRVELTHDRLWIRSETQEIELSTSEAREVAQLILRATGK